MNRYDRQIKCHAFGQKGQTRIENATFLIIGAGALGSAVSEQLTRAGAGKLIICDMDVVAYSNLHRQSCYTEQDASINRLKVSALTTHLQHINHQVDIIPLTDEITSLNIEALITTYTPTLIIDGTDTFSTRFLINEACHKHHIPWVYGACLGTKGTVYAIDYSGPCLRCLIDENQTSGQDCSIEGILPPVAHLAASMQVAEIMNYIANGKFSNQLITFNTQTMHFNQTKTAKLKDNNCPTCHKKFYHQLQVQPEKITKLCGGKYMVRLDAHYFVHTKLAFQKISPHFKYYENEHYQLSFFHDGRAIINGAENSKDAERIIKALL